MILVGDFNAYSAEPPITEITSNGFVSFADTGDYSYLFDGQFGTLDHVFIKSSAQSKIRVDAAVWHCNADELDYIDYNLNYGRDASIFDSSIPERFSDHDPIIMGLTFLDQPSESPSSTPSISPTKPSQVTSEVPLTITFPNDPTCEVQHEVASNIQRNVEADICASVGGTSCTVEVRPPGSCSLENRKLVGEISQARNLQTTEVTFLIIITVSAPKILPPSELQSFENAIQSSVKELNVPTILCSNSSNDPLFADTCNTNQMQPKVKKMKNSKQPKLLNSKQPKENKMSKLPTKSPKTKQPNKVPKKSKVPKM